MAWAAPPRTPDAQQLRVPPTSAASGSPQVGETLLTSPPSATDAVAPRDPLRPSHLRERRPSVMSEMRRAADLPTARIDVAIVR